MCCKSCIFIAKVGIIAAIIQAKIKEMVFREWTTQALMREFKLEKVKSCSLLEETGFLCPLVTMKE